MVIYECDYCEWLTFLKFQITLLYWNTSLPHPSIELSNSSTEWYISSKLDISFLPEQQHLSSYQMAFLAEIQIKVNTKL